MPISVESGVDSGPICVVFDEIGKKALGGMQISLEIDHLVISAVTLAEGVALVENALGVRMAPGGKHPLMGTHNALLSLGEIYLEVIAIDPDAPSPGRPRWFDLDNFSGPPRLTNWVARTDDLAGAAAIAPPGVGVITDVTRGDLNWSMSVPEDGCLPFDGAFPGLIQWHGAAHPNQRLPQAECRLELVQIAHPQAEDLRSALARFDGGLAACAAFAAQKQFHAAISTISGLKALA